MIEAAITRDPNKSVLEFLHRYSDPKNEFGYGVMVKEKWGSGKTYLIKERFIKQRECPSSGNLRLIRHFEKRGSGSSGVRV